MGFCVWKAWWSRGPRELAVFSVLFGENKSLFSATWLMFEVNEGHKEFTWKCACMWGCAGREYPRVFIQSVTTHLRLATTWVWNEVRKEENSARREPSLCPHAIELICENSSAREVLGHSHKSWDCPSLLIVGHRLKRCQGLPKHPIIQDIISSSVKLHLQGGTWPFPPEPEWL